MKHNALKFYTARKSTLIDIARLKFKVPAVPNQDFTCKQQKNFGIVGERRYYDTNRPLKMKSMNLYF